MYEVLLFTVIISVQITLQQNTEVATPVTPTIENPFNIPKPTIVQDTLHNVVYKAERVTLQCKVDAATSEFKYDWYNFGKFMQQTNQPILTISAGGDYECVAKVGDYTSEKSGVHNLIQHETPTAKLTLDSQWKEFYTTEKILLKCEVVQSSDHWTYKWFQNAKALSDTNPTFEIQSAEERHSGNYTCKGMLPGRTVETEKSSTVTIEIHERPQPSLNIETKWKQFFQTENVNVKCLITKNQTEWDYEWYKSKERLSKSQFILLNGDSLTILFAKTSDSGMYTCKGKNKIRPSVTTIESHGLSIEVNAATPKPELKTNPFFEFLYTGETVQLKCDMSDDYWTYDWYKNGQPASQISKNSTYTINSASLGMAGMYCCEAKRGGFSVKSEKINLQVKEPPQPTMTIESQWKQFYPHEDVTLKCSIGEISNEWAYDWFKNEQQITKNNVPAGNNLYNIKATPSDSGQYTCKGNHLKRPVVQTKESVALQLIVHENTQPDLQQHPMFEFFYTKEQIQLNCKMDGDGWTFELFKDSEQSNSIVTNPNHTIISASVTDSGDYLCQAKRGGFSVNSTVLKVQVKEPPQPTMTIESQWKQFYPHEDVSLNCSIANISNEWAYDWFKNGQQITKSNVPAGNNLYNIKATPSDSGQYTCKGNHLQRPVVQTKESVALQLIVHEPPQPTMTLESQWKQFYPHEDVTLNCSIANISNEWAYDWFKNGQLITKFNVPTGNNLYNIKGTPSDSGQYTCKGNHLKRPVVHTKESAALQLIVHDYTIPDLKQHPMFEIFYTEEQIQLSCKMAGDGWTFDLYKNSQQSIVTNPNHTIISASVTDSGDYFCQAKRRGFSVNSKVLKVHVKARSTAVLKLETEISDIVTGNNLNLNCDVEDEHEWNYTWFENGKKLVNTSKTFQLIANDDNIKSEFKCQGVRTERPLYSELSEGFMIRNTLFKRKIVLAFTGCVLSFIGLLVIGCIILKITRKPVKEEPVIEDLFISMMHSKEKSSPLSEYMDGNPEATEDAEEAVKLVVSAVHEEGQNKDESSPVAEDNGLSSFKGK